MRWQSKKKTTKKKPFKLVQLMKSCQIQLKYQTTAEPRRAVPAPGVKVDQMMGPKVLEMLEMPCFNSHIFLEGCKGGSRAAAFSSDRRSYLCSSQFGLKVIMQDWLHSSELCRLFNLPSSVDLPLQRAAKWSLW